MNNDQLTKLGLAVIDTELGAIESLKSRINEDFAKACQLLLDCKGRVVATGMGKCGHIGCKIAATMASTGTPERDSIARILRTRLSNISRPNTEATPLAMDPPSTSTNNFL